MKQSHVCLVPLCVRSQLAINEASTARTPTPQQKLEKEVFVFRSYIALGKHVVVLDEIPEDEGTATELAIVRLQARQASGTLSPDAVAASVLSYDEDVEGRDKTAGGSLLRGLAGSVLAGAGSFAEALRVVRRRESMEQMAVETHCLLAIDRADLAAEAAGRMRAADDEAPLAVLATAWVSQASGPERANEATAAYHELMDKFGPTQQLLSGLGAACLAAGRFADAEGHLIKAASVGPASAAVLANLVACARHLGKPAEATRRLAEELERDFPGTALAEASAAARAAVDRVTSTA